MQFCMDLFYQITISEEHFVLALCRLRQLSEKKSFIYIYFQNTTRKGKLNLSGHLYFVRVHQNLHKFLF